MKFDKFILIVFLILFCGCAEKTKKEISAIEEEISQLNSIEDKKLYLEKILEDDQAVRNSEKSAELMLKYGNDSEEYMEYVKTQWKQDEINLHKIEAYLKKFGYPKNDEMGKNAVTAPWIVIHHQTDTGIRNRNFEILYKAYLNGDIDDTAMSFYLGRTYEFTFRERFKMESPFKSEDEINKLIEKLNLEEEKANAQ
ncbi:MAG TPA: hypothetical protein ENJ95_02395 [Bacteroidetes bacterium]|nr:hypothetical protein [Bacteroidota bacterium]